MKKFKRLLAVFMSAVILLSSMAISSLAATSKVKSVDINVDVAPGINMSDYDEYITINTPGVSIEEDSVYVYDYYNYVTIVGGEFEKCGSYSVVFGLLVDSGYSWSEDMFEGAIVNGDYADCWFDEGVLHVEYFFNFYGSVTDIDLTVDVYGEMYKSMYNRYVTFNTYGLGFNDVKFDAVNVFDAEGNEVDEFVAGEDYTLEMFFEPIDECYFEKDASGNFVMNSVTVNGEDVEYFIGSYTVNGYYEYVKITAQVTAKSANIVKNITIDIDDNLAGVSVEDIKDYVTIKTEGLGFCDNYTVDAYNYLINEYVSVLEKGAGYYLSFYITAEDGYTLPFDGCFDSITINGDDDNWSYYDVYYSSDVDAYVAYIEMDIDLRGSFFDQLMYMFRYILDSIRSLIAEYFLNIFPGK